MAKKSKRSVKTISNRRARYDYELGDALVAGISLTGRETKSLRLGHGHLKGAYVTLKDGELWLINATITSANGYMIDPDEQTRPRKLLVKKRELDALSRVKEEGRTLVPLELMTKGRYIKLRLSAGKGRKRYDKRQLIKKRDQAREAQRSIANKHN